jgi:hypothetical protein
MRGAGILLGVYQLFFAKKKVVGRLYEGSRYTPEVYNIFCKKKSFRSREIVEG